MVNNVMKSEKFTHAVIISVENGELRAAGPPDFRPNKKGKASKTMSQVINLCSEHAIKLSADILKITHFSIAVNPLFSWSRINDLEFINALDDNFSCHYLSEYYLCLSD